MSLDKQKSKNQSELISLKAGRENSCLTSQE